MKNFTKELLEELYLIRNKTPYEIANELKCDHKTVRKYLRLHGIPLRSAPEYNYLCRKTHESPTQESLHSPLSMMAHTAYLCEGWHTENTTTLAFCNTDPILIDVFLQCLRKVYGVNPDSISLVIASNTPEEAIPLAVRYPAAKLIIEKGRRTPILRIRAGGKVLAAEFIRNAYSLILEVTRDAEP